MANRQYVGARYVPKFADPVEWNKALSYEALTIVTHLGNSFTSKKPVPADVDIGNSEYWVNTGNYNEQIATYQQQVTTLANTVQNLSNKVGHDTTINVDDMAGDNFTQKLKAAISTCSVHGAIYIPWTGEARTLTEGVLIDKPLNIISNYAGYFNGYPSLATPLIEFTGTGYAFTIKSMGFHAENITIKCNGSNSGIQTVYDPDGGYGLVFEHYYCNCMIYNGSYGFNFQNMFKSVVINCVARSCKTGINASKQTSTTYVSCWAADCSEYGWRIDDTVYSSLINCACDGLKGGKYAYEITDCRGLTLTGCACETGNGSVHVSGLSTRGIHIDSFYDTSMDTDKTTEALIYIEAGYVTVTSYSTNTVLRDGLSHVKYTGGAVSLVNVNYKINSSAADIYAGLYTNNPVYGTELKQPI